MKNKDKKNGSDYNQKNIKVAVFCIAALVIFYLGASFLKGLDILGKRDYYYTVMDNAGGLVEGTAVSINGYKIGKVTEITLASCSPVKICAELLITEKVSLPKDSKFEIASKDILGGITVNVIMGQSEEIAQSGDTLTSYFVPPMTDGIDKMKNRLDGILASVDTIALSLKEVMYTDNGAGDIKQVLANLESSTAHLNELVANNKTKFGNIVSDLEQFSQTLEKASPQLNNIVDNFDNISDSLAKADFLSVINKADKTVGQLEDIVQKVNRGDGSLGQVVNNDTLYRNLDASLSSLNALIKDIKANPKKYINVTVFGKKEKK